MILNNKPTEKITFVGSIEKIFFNKDTFYIAMVSIDKLNTGVLYDYNEVITLKGTMPSIAVGKQYKINAKLVCDPKYGYQYEVISMFDNVTFDKNDKVGQKKFLLNIFTELQVENMYKALDDPYEALTTGKIEELIKIKGCGFDTAVRWTERIKKHIDKAKIYIELEDYCLTNNMVDKLLARYKSPDLVINCVKNNPYVLCNEVDGIGWKTADAIALRGGMETYAVKRIEAYILYYLNESGKKGFSWITPDELLGGIIEMLGEEVPDSNITEAIRNLEKELWCSENKDKIGLQKYYNIEKKIAEELIRIRDAETKIQYNNFEDTIKHLEHKQGWTFTDEQKRGAKIGLDNNVVVITGGSGVGKTSTVGLILEVLKNYSFVQCALSGRASSRMKEVTDKEGYTIHRLLGYPLGDKNGFVFHDENPLPHDIYIVDEISMIDSYLFYYLLRAIPSGSKLFLLGDPGQLESIGAGNVAHDMILSEEIPSVLLTQIHRQAAKSAIITESIKIRTGQQIIEKDWVGMDTRGELQDLNLDIYSDKSNTFYKIMEKFSFALAQDNFNILEEQIIVPIKSGGMSSTYEINNAIQELYNPSSRNKKEYTAYIEGKPYILRTGDKVINVVNNYNTKPNIYNGNIGIIQDFTRNEEGEEIMVIDFMSIGLVEIEKKYWNNIELAYAITVHKSQGSEFNHVIFGVDFSSYSLLKRELIYTGITRAKTKCDLIAQTGALRMATSKEGVNKKQTHLQYCLHEIAHPKLLF